MSENGQTKFKRVILKISGEILGSREEGEPIFAESLERVCSEIKAVADLGTEVGLVVGGGNIFRGLRGAKKGIERTTGDSMGMLATVINGLALMDCLEKMGAVVRVQTAIPMEKLAEPFIKRRAVRHLERGRIVIFVAGTGNPYFSTDTTAALRASEIGADIILKATKVDGIYDKDPHEHDDAVKFDHLSYMECIEKRLSVMDSTAFSLCMDNQMPILVFDLQQENSIHQAVTGEKIGTLVN
ncbi:MAG: UMP kinase [Opitutae bacterium]|jgi:uridylate kinase|nr:UMP kinase [Opitutae bacterium]MBT5909486.1 UMP kinase [Opitutae bacterium]MBT6850743.1 UMP kinase [Opitutae bacterium]MBT7743382.1 UMP kinase [Opitutae bacterium]